MISNDDVDDDDEDEDHGMSKMMKMSLTLMANVGGHRKVTGDDPPLGPNAEVHARHRLSVAAESAAAAVPGAMPKNDGLASMSKP